MHMFIYILYMKSLTPTMEQGALYTYVTYMTEQIWLQQWKYSLHRQHTSLTYRTDILDINAKEDKLQIPFHVFIQNLCQKQIYPPCLAYMPY